MSDKSISDEAVEAAAIGLVNAQTNGLCTDRWPRACSVCDCFRDGNAGPGCDAFGMEREQARAALDAAVPIIRAEIAAEIEARMPHVHGVAGGGVAESSADDCSDCQWPAWAARIARGQE